jgi:hypothetical protein
MLSTPPHGDAVSVGYRLKLKSPDEDVHLADSVHLQTHQAGFSETGTVSHD